MTTTIEQQEGLTSDKNRKTEVSKKVIELLASERMPKVDFIDALSNLPMEGIELSRSKTHGRKNDF